MFNEHLCPVFRALADPRRLCYVELLVNGDVSFGELAGLAPLAQTSVIHHLKVLEECGLLLSRKEGRQRLYTLRPERLEAAYDWMEQISGQLDRRARRTQPRVSGSQTAP